MAEYSRPYPASDYVAPHKRIGVVTSADLEISLTGPLIQIQASFARIDPAIVDPWDRELEQYHAIILQVSDSEVESNWLRPESLRANTRPLLLAGNPEAFYHRASLQYHAGDIIFAPFARGELVLRLSRLMGGTLHRQHNFVRATRPCVLIADDDPDIVTYLKCVLQSFDVDVHSANDGVAALAATRKLLPDLLLLDIGMPGLSGIDILRCLKNDPGTRGIQILLLTASADPLDVKNGVELGAADYILKPFAQIGLIVKLKSHLSDHRPRRRSEIEAGSSLPSEHRRELSRVRL